MSHTVMRGKPTKSQLYLDIVLDDIRTRSKCDSIVRERYEVNLSEIIYQRMQQQIDDIFMINGASGEKITYRQILNQAIPLARALRYQYEKGTHVMFLMKNHENMASVYYSSLFAGVLPLPLDPYSTSYEIRHFISLVDPAIIFCEPDRYDEVKVVAQKYNPKIAVVIADGKKLRAFYKGHDVDFETFKVLDSSPESLALFIPTSGSSGLPKATMLSHKGLIAQLSIIWSYFQRFPRPTELVLLLSTAQWLTHTILMTSCPVFGVTLLMSPEKPSAENVLNILEKFRPTWALLGPVFAKSLAASARADQLESLKVVITAGAPLTPNIITTLQEKLPKSTHLSNGLGLTETHGFITMPGPGTSWNSNGKLVNTFLYKIVPEDGKSYSSKGELYLKSNSSIFKGYYKNEKTYREMFTDDGWLMTGDIFTLDENNDFYYVERKNFWFKYLNYHIAPEEVEIVISSVAGVQECVVTETERGPAAAVVLRADHAHSENSITEQIHRTVNSFLSDYKRLRGGIVIVSSLPCTHSGKIKRIECKNIINCILKNGNCL